MHRVHVPAERVAKLGSVGVIRPDRKRGGLVGPAFVQRDDDCLLAHSAPGEVVDVVVYGRGSGVAGQHGLEGARAQRPVLVEQLRERRVVGDHALIGRSVQARIAALVEPGVGGPVVGVVFGPVLAVGERGCVDRGLMMLWGRR
jgi:hypothetical protein